MAESRLQPRLQLHELLEEDLQAVLRCYEVDVDQAWDVAKGNLL